MCLAGADAEIKCVVARALHKGGQLADGGLACPLECDVAAGEVLRSIGDQGDLGIPVDFWDAP